MPVRTRLQIRSQELSDTNVTLFLSATFVLVNAGFISARELGSISPVCQSTNECIREENEIWATLCHLRFPSCEKGFKPSVVKNKGHKWLYKHLAVPIDRLYTHPRLDPPSCTCEDLQLVFRLYHDGTQILHRVIDSPSHNDVLLGDW